MPIQSSTQLHRPFDHEVAGIPTGSSAPGMELIFDL